MKKHNSTFHKYHNHCFHEPYFPWHCSTSRSNQVKPFCCLYKPHPIALALLQTKLDRRSSYSLILVLRFSCRVLNQKLMDSLVGFRFHPTDEEIILLLTMKRRDPAGFSVRTIKEIDLYSFEPWELPCK